MVDGIPVLDLSAGALLAITVILVLTGRLVPRRNLEDVCSERDQWRKAHDERAAQLTQALDSADVATRALDALANRVEGTR